MLIFGIIKDDKKYNSCLLRVHIVLEKTILKQLCVYNVYECICTSTYVCIYAHSVDGRECTRVGDRGKEKETRKVLLKKMGPEQRLKGGHVNQYTEVRQENILGKQERC